MNSNARGKWQVRFLVLAIFIVGFASGALSIHLYRGRLPSFGQGNARSRFQQTIDKLNLTPDQRSQVDAIFDDARAQLAEIRKESEPRFRELRQKTDERLQTVLTPEQWQQFKEMTSEGRRRRPHRNDKD
jgi:Spy/CpxP family protein refolding chaperone